MLTTTDAAALYAHVVAQLGDGSAPSWHAANKAKKAKYRAAVEALADIADPLDRAVALHVAVSALWGAPGWIKMQGPERAAYLFAAGSQMSS